MSELEVRDVLDYSRDIEPYQFIKIFAGVGSGKTSFICDMITGNKDKAIPKQTVLLITSRRSTVEEALRRMGDEVKSRASAYGNLSREVYTTGEVRPYDYEEYVKIIKDADSLSEYACHNKSVVCTNAHIEQYLKLSYIPNDPATHLWELFDTIVIDEVHSLVTDATYQTAPFHVLELMNYVLSVFKDVEKAEKRLIIMTGTPDPLKSLDIISFPEEKTANYNLFDKCRRVLPKTITVIDKVSAIRKLHTILNNGEKAVYFSNSVMTPNSVREKWKIDKAIKVSVSFTSDLHRRAVGKAIREDIDSVGEALASSKKIPDDIKLFVTTSRNKEGINIENEDIHHLFVETHFPDDIIQMAGRIRSGVENLYIISNISQNVIAPNEVAIGFITSHIVPTESEHSGKPAGDANVYLKTLCEEAGISNIYANAAASEAIYRSGKEKVIKYIDYIVKSISYSQYSYFLNCFVFYKQRMKSETYVYEKTSALTQALIQGEDNTKKLIGDMFPEVPVVFGGTPMEQCRLYLEENIFVHRKCNRRKLTPAQYTSISYDLGEILGREVIYLNTVVEKLGFTVSKKDKNGFYWLTRVKK